MVIPSIPNFGDLFTGVRPNIFPLAPSAVSGLIAAWTPHDSSTLKQAVAGTGSVANGDPVGYMSGAVNAVATADDTTRPTWNATGINGFGALALDGAVPQKLTGNAIGTALAGSDKPFTWIGVICVHVLAANQCFFSLGASGSATPFHLFRAQVAGALGGRLLSSRRGDSGGSADVQSVNTSAGSIKADIPAVIGLRFTGTTADIWIGGQQVVVLTAQDTPDLTGLNQYTLGALRTTTISQPLTGLIGDHCIYDNAISGLNLMSVTRYYRDLYQI